MGNLSGKCQPPIHSLEPIKALRAKTERGDNETPAPLRHGVPRCHFHLDTDCKAGHRSPTSAN